ncbi:MAG: SIMPL domain-containing protein [Actinomycetota bacterium]|nr:SIMPL domain-containing protein [Actinomycetota bacterium]
MRASPTPLLLSPTVRAVGVATALVIGLLLAYSLGTARPQVAQAVPIIPTSVAGPGSSPAFGVEVVGTGKVAGTPDVLRLDLAVTATRSQATDSLDSMSRSAGKVIAALKSHRVAGKDIKTSGLSLQPNYDYANGKTTLRGYLASEQISATLRDLRRAGAAITAAVGAGGNAARVEGVALDLEGDSGLLAKARLAAIADARAKAEAYAKAAGRALGPVTVISENVTPATPQPLDTGRFDAAGGAPARPVPVETGSQQVSISVRVVWSFTA